MYVMYVAITSPEKTRTRENFTVKVKAKSHRQSVTRNIRGAQSDSQNFLRGTAIRTVTIFSLSYRKF